MTDLREYSLPEIRLTSLKGHSTGVIRSIRYNHDGKYCMTTGSDRTVVLWNPEKNLQLKVYSGHGQDVLCCCSSFDNAKIASGSKDQSVIIWDVLSGQAIRRLRQHHSQINCIQYGGDSDSSLLFSGSTDNTICVWDALSKSQKPVQILNNAKDSILDIKIHAHYLLTASVDCHLRLYDIRQGQIYEDCLGFPVTSCEFALDANTIIGSCNQSIVKVIDTSTGKMLNKFDGHLSRNYKSEIKMINNDSYILCGSEDGCIYVWDFVTTKLVKKIKTNNSVVYSLDYHPTLPQMLTASTDGASVWGK